MSTGNKVLRTKLCDMLGIEYPIIQAGMGTISGPTLVAAVSNAGGLGVLAAIDLTAEELRQWIRQTRKLTNKPFAVDTVFMKNLPESMSMDEVEAKLPPEAVSYAQKVRENLGLPPVHGRPNTYICSRRVIEEQFQVCVEEGIDIIVSALGSPDWFVNEIHAHNIKILGLVGNVKDARRVAESGADIIIAQGYEAGGHTGRIGTMALVPQVVDAVYPTPVIAAGGIADGRGLVAALALGTIGVWCGTAFAATHEAAVDHVTLGIYPQWEIDLRKQRILQATEDDARITRVVTGKTLRNLVNKFVVEWEKSGGPVLKQWPSQSILIADIEEGIRQKHLAEYVPWSPGGQIAGMIKELKSARQVVEDMVNGARKILTEKFPQEIDTGKKKRT